MARKAVRRVVVSARFTEAEHEQLRKAAEAGGLTVSDLLRYAALRDARHPRTRPRWPETATVAAAPVGFTWEIPRNAHSVANVQTMTCRCP